MYACLHSPHLADPHALLALAGLFSPAIEQTDANTVVFSISPLRKLLGSPHQIASEICRTGYEQQLQASLAVASNPDSAILLARHTTGVILVTPGEEHLKIASIPLRALLHHDVPVDAGVVDICERWGLRTCADLAALPVRGVLERLGAAGAYLHKLASGQIDRPLRLLATELEYAEEISLDHPVDTLEPLLFLFARVLNTLCARLQQQSQAARLLQIHFSLDNRQIFECALEFPVPLQDSSTILKLLQLDLERHGPPAAVVSFRLRLQPAAPRRAQSNLFVPPVPQPEKLQVTLARIGALVGKENVGTPGLLNTHRPDAWDLQTLNTAPLWHAPPSSPPTLRLALHLFRPALEARVTLAGTAPHYVRAAGVSGNVLQWAGPWKISGDWWTTAAWVREEWDVALDDGALYRIYQQPAPQNPLWYVAAVYD